jgi:hypothetical protein
MIDMEMKPGGGSHWNFVAYCRRVIPMKIARFMIGVSIQLSVQWESMISFLVILVSFDMGKGSGLIEVGKRMVQLVDEVPVGGECRRHVVIGYAV